MPGTMWLSYARATVVSIDRFDCDTFASYGLVSRHGRLPNYVICGSDAAY